MLCRSLLINRGNHVQYGGTFDEGHVCGMGQYVLSQTSRLVVLGSTQSSKSKVHSVSEDTPSLSVYITYEDEQQAEVAFIIQRQPSLFASLFFLKLHMAYQTSVERNLKECYFMCVCGLRNHTELQSQSSRCIFRGHAPPPLLQTTNFIIIAFDKLNELRSPQ